MNLTGRPVFQKSAKVGTAMRNEARGEACRLRIPGVCNRDPETTVLAHLRMFGWAGTGEKPEDYLAVFACSACHDVLDRRSKRGELDPWDLVRAFGETLKAQVRAGNLVMK